jgi:NADH-quinone oxidoreductase subunit M
MTLFLIFFPLIIALLLFAIRTEQAKWIAFAASLIELAVTIFMLFQFQKNATIQFAFNTPWIVSLGLNFSVGLDGISLLLVLLTSVLTPFIILSSFGNTYNTPHTFYGLILTMQAALVGVFAARDGLLFYLFWEMALIPIYFICLIWGGENRGRITLKFFIYTLAGSLFMLIALVYLYLQTPTKTFDILALYEAGRALPLHDQNLIFWAMFIAFAIKMPVFPFHTWQPDTYTVAPAQGTMLLSGIMLKMGIYGLIRWLVPVVPLAFQEWGSTAIVLSVIGIIYASAIALVQKDYKRLIAYSSIAHVGLISAGLLTWTSIGVQGAMIQMLSHGIIAVGLFFIVEIIFERTKSMSLDNLGGIRNVAPALTAAFIIIMLGSVALPLTSGFVGEFLLINAIFQYQNILGAIAGLTIILGAVYMLVAFQRAMSGETNSVTASFVDLSLHEKFVLYPIVLMVLLMGIFPNPLMEISEAAVANLINSINEVSTAVK